MQKVCKKYAHQQKKTCTKIQHLCSMASQQKKKVWDFHVFTVFFFLFFSSFFRLSTVNRTTSSYCASQQFTFALVSEFMIFRLKLKLHEAALFFCVCMCVYYGHIVKYSIVVRRMAEKQNDDLTQTISMCPGFVQNVIIMRIKCVGFNGCSEYRIEHK